LTEASEHQQRCIVADGDHEAAEAGRRSATAGKAAGLARSLRQVVHRAKQPRDVAGRVSAAAWRPAGIADEVWYVVVDQAAGEADLLERSQRGRHVHVPLADEALGKLVASALDVAEVDVDDLAARAEVANSVQHVVIAAHLRPAAHAEEQPP